MPADARRQAAGRAALVHEIKWDGYRVSAYVAEGKATIRTRNGHDWTKRFPSIAAAVGQAEGAFGRDRRRGRNPRRSGPFELCGITGRPGQAGSERAALYAFDLLFLDGEDLRAKPLEERRLALGGIIPARSAILMSEEYTGSGADLFKIACKHELEGIGSKRLAKPYRSGSRLDWLKTKCVQSGEFVIIGYQPTSGAVRGALANIKVASFDGTRLQYAGAVGTGFSDAAAP